MSTLQLFAQRDFKGESVIIYKDTPDLSAHNILKVARSLVVIGEPWIVFTNIDYRGEFKCFQEGNHKSLPLWENQISAVRVVRGGLANPNITVHDEINHGGKKMTLERPVPSLGKLHLTVSSYKVASGAWVFYSSVDYKGDKMITLTSDDIQDMSKIGWQNKVKSLKPYEDE